MKKFIFIPFILFSFLLNAQRISVLPTINNKGLGGFLPISQSGVTSKISVDSLVKNANNYTDSLRYSLNIKSLYKEVFPVANIVTWNFDTTQTIKITANTNLALLLSGQIPTGAAGIALVTQTGGNELSFNNTALKIAKIAAKNTIVGMVRLNNGYIFTVDTTSIFIGDSTAIVYDVNAQALFTAANTNSSYRAAVNNAITSLKGVTLAAGGTAWTKSLMINGRAGSSLLQQSYNWKDTGAYKYTYNGTFVYNPNGTQFDGSTNSLSLGFTPSIAFTQTTTDISTINIVGVAPTIGGVFFGGLDGATGTNFFKGMNATQITSSFYYPEVALTPVSVTGRYISSFSTATNFNTYRNGTLIDSRAVAPTATHLTFAIAEGAAGIANGGLAYFTNPRIDVTQIIQSKLTANEAAQIDAIWATYQTALNR